MRTLQPLDSGSLYSLPVRRPMPECEERRAELDELGRRMWMGGIADAREG